MPFECGARMALPIQFPDAKHVANSILIRAAAAAAMAMAMVATISSWRRVAVNAYFIFSFH